MKALKWFNFFLVVSVLTISFWMVISQCPDPPEPRCQDPCNRDDFVEDNTYCTMATEDICCEYNYTWYECEIGSDPDTKSNPSCHPKHEWVFKSQFGVRERRCHTCKQVPGEPSFVKRCELKPECAGET